MTSSLRNSLICKSLLKGGRRIFKSRIIELSDVAGFDLFRKTEKNFYSRAHFRDESAYYL